MTSLEEYTSEEVAKHKTKNDLWIVVHGKVYNVTEYVRDHPGGADVLCDVAGTDATAAYEDVGHSEDADEIMKTYLIGTMKGAREFTRSKAVRVIPQVPPQATTTETPSTSIGSISMATGLAGGAAVLVYLYTQGHLPLNKLLSKLSKLPQHLPAWARTSSVPNKSLAHGGFLNGLLTSSAVFAVVGSIVGSKLSKFTQIQSGFTRYPPHKKIRKMPVVNPHELKGFLEPKDFKELPLIAKTQLSPSVYRFTFQLPGPRDVIGLPIGQHVAIKATVNGQSVSRSYTPTSNNLDLGVLELVIKCYPDGLLTGQYLANLNVGDKVLFRGPKGAMKYRRGLCRRIGMIAGGTGITPMYQLIRAICEDERDTTEISLIYANRSEEDILLREELEAFARRYKNLKIWYMLDVPPENWTYGKGYVTAQVMSDKLPKPAEDTKIMLCGPPGMVNASKKALASLGFEAPSAVAKVADQIFCF
ncbi:cytochrome b5 reductase [Penicillium cinerascens]|uniref:Cytochrome b5 reductase n=1 Tax=Penicillium cinerascens TaxID=70096 RepID=A0A9W9MMR0_9EURO|nr:cytochrome b5 reductase [Penicillium cinerascens]KAJ5204195.1 cytochrome b5 reductase [Penicillium cinerascens]